MTLAEALKLSDRVKRKYDNTDWFTCTDRVQISDALADDWIAYREPRTYELYINPETGAASTMPDQFYRYEKIKVIEVIK